jgi:hypothetical protein
VAAGKETMEDQRKNAISGEGITPIMARLFLVGCALVLVGAIGDLLVIMCKWIGYAVLLFVILGTIVRMTFDKWPEWVTTPCIKIKMWLDR